jgi:hypothetical protein
MLLPPTNGYGILIYGRDFTLLDTRRMLLASWGFQADTVSTFDELRSAVYHAQPTYELLILCHTVSKEDRAMVRHLIENTGIGLYQLERLIPPKRFLNAVSGKTYEDADSQENSLLRQFYFHPPDCRFGLVFPDHPGHTSCPAKPFFIAEERPPNLRRNLKS